MATVDLAVTTVATSKLPSLDGRPCPGKPGDGNAAGWGATESFFSLLTQCSLVPAVAAESAPLPAGTAGAAMPFFKMPTPEVVADPTPDAAALVDGPVVAAATAGAAMPFFDMSTAEMVADAAPDAAAQVDGDMVAAAPAGPAMSAAAVFSLESAPVVDTMAGDGETPAPCAITIRPPYAAGGPAATTRPLKGPIFVGLRPWATQETATPPATPLDPKADNLRGAGAKPTSLPGGKPAPAVNEPSPSVLATPGDVYESPAGLAPQAASVSPAPSTAPEALACAAPVATTSESPASESPAPVVESIGGMSADLGAQGRHAQPESQAGAEAAVPSGAAVTEATTGAMFSPVATALSAALSVLKGVGAAGSAATAPGSANPAGSIDPATGASIRAQLLAEVAAQSVGATGHEKIVLHLEPAHLGKVQVQLQANGSRLEIIVQAQNPEAENALADGAQELVEAIVGRGEGRWQQVEVRFERSPGEREQRQSRDDMRDGGEQRRGNQQGRRRDNRAGR